MRSPPRTADVDDRFERLVARAQPARRLAPLHADEGARRRRRRPRPRRQPADRDRIGRGPVADRRRGQALPRRHQLVVDQPVRPRPSGHPGGAGRPAVAARPHDARRADPPAGRRAVGAPRGADRPRPRVLRQRRRLGHRDRAEDERAPLAQRRPAGQEPLRRAAGRLPRRDGRRARRDRHRAVPRGLCPAGAAVHHRDEPRRAQRRSTARRPPTSRYARRAPSRSGSRSITRRRRR